MRDQERLFGEVASLPTRWRGLNEIDNGALVAITAARNKVRERVWELIAARHGRIPPVRICYGDLGAVICIRIDASLIEAHSDKQHAAGNFKGGYGFHPLLAWCDNTGELLAVIPRAGNAGSNSAADHVAIIDAAIAAIPARYRRNLLITIDGAGSSHKVVEHLSALNNPPGWSVAYSVGFDLDERVRAAIGQTPAQAWEDALDARGAARDDAAVTDLTGILRHSHPGDTLAGWPPDMRVLVRREDIEDGAQLSLFEQLGGHRYQPMATNTAGGHPQRLEARHLVHARVEGFIRCGKATGLARWPSNSFAINTAWVAAVTMAIDLPCWTRLLLLDGPLAAAEPATLRYRLLHTAVRIIDHARRRILRVPETWSWAEDFNSSKENNHVAGQDGHDGQARSGRSSRQLICAGGNGRSRFRFGHRTNGRRGQPPDGKFSQLGCLAPCLAPLVLVNGGKADPVRGGGRERQADGSRHGVMVSVGRR